MKNTTLRGSLILSVLLFFMACKKEYSVENGVFGGVAQGELVDSLGNCKNPTVVGNYIADTALNPTTNYVIINVNFTSQGKYKIYSDTMNGMWFIDSGFTVSAGTTTIKLKGYGTPILPKVTDFALMFNNTLCGFSITVTGSGGSSGGTGTKGDYFPTTSGSTWEYQYLPKLGTADKFTVTVAQDQVQVSGDPIVYSKFGTSLTDTFYFGKDGLGNYYTLSTIDFDYTFVFDSVPTPAYISYIFLKENAAVGTSGSWSTPDYGEVKLVSASGTEYGTAKTVFTIISKNTNPHTVGGKTYNDVIDVKREIMFKANNSSTYKLVLSGDCFYAKNYGLIDQILNLTPIQNISITTEPVIK